MYRDKRVASRQLFCTPRTKSLGSLTLVTLAIVLARGEVSLRAAAPPRESRVVPSQALDAAIVTNLTARVKKHMALRITEKRLFVAMASISDRRLTLKLDDGECDVLYSGNTSLFYYDRGVSSMAYPPEPGVLLKPMRAIQVGGVEVRAEELLLRTERGWEAAPTDRIVAVLREALTTPVPANGDKKSGAVRKLRAVAAAGCVLLGKDASPLTDQLLALFKEKQLDYHEVVAACQALAITGGPEVATALVAVRARIGNSKAMKDAVTEAQKNFPIPSPTTASLEKTAAGKLRLAKQFLDRREPEKAKGWLQNVVKDYPDTEAAKEASQLLKGIE